MYCLLANHVELWQVRSNPVWSADLWDAFNATVPWDSLNVPLPERNLSQWAFESFGRGRDWLANDGQSILFSYLEENIFGSTCVCFFVLLSFFVTAMVYLFFKKNHVYFF